MKKVLTPADNMGITLTEAKDFLRVEHDLDDDLITQIVKSSTLLAQNIVGQQLTTATYIQGEAKFAYEIDLFSPVQSVTSVKYYDENNTLQTISTLSYQVLDFGLPHKLVFNPDYSFPAIYNRKDALQITYTCGMTTIPEDIQTFIKIKCGTAYELREEYQIGFNQMSKLEDKYLLQFLTPYRVF